MVIGNKEIETEIKEVFNSLQGNTQDVTENEIFDSLILYSDKAGVKEALDMLLCYELPSEDDDGIEGGDKDRKVFRIHVRESHNNLVVL